MADLNFNAGRLGMSPEKLMAIGYQKLEASVKLYGYTVDKQTSGKAVVSAPDGTVIATYTASDILRGYAF